MKFGNDGLIGVEFVRTLSNETPGPVVTAY